VKYEWIDTFRTSVGDVRCALRSDLPFNLPSNGIDRVVVGGYRIRRTVHLLPLGWSGTLIVGGPPIAGGCCWRWYVERMTSDPADLTLGCGLLAEDSMFWDSATGENLAAVEYRNGDQVLHIGTEDDDNLWMRTKNESGWFPPRFESLLKLPSEFSQDLIKLTKQEIEISVPALDVGERVYFHFIAAYQECTSVQDISTWIAVDRSKRQLDDVFGELTT
jgi:hypothetical protein